MLSATPDAAAAANAAFQAAPSWLTRSSPPPANDLFGNLVSQNAQGQSAGAQPPAPQPSQNNGPEAPPPAADHSPAANHSAPNPPPANNNSNNNGADAGQPSDANNNADASANTSTNSAAGNGANSSSSTATAGASQSGDQKSADSQGDDDGDDDSTAMDATILAQQAGSATPTPVAVVMPTSTPTTNTPAAPTAGSPTAPLAIAAAAIAASSQPLSPPPAPSAPGKADAGTTPATTSGGAAGKTATATATITANAGPQAASPTTLDAAAITTTVAASQPVTPKTGQAKAEAPASDGSANNPTSTTAPADQGQTGVTPQTLATAKPETANVALQGTTADAATPAPVTSSHDHATAANAVTHASADSAGANPEAGAFQPQFNSTAALSSASNLTATAATSAAVPLGGVALEIVANVKSGKSSFEIRLDPADLGRIDVRVQIDQNGQVTSHLTVEKPETLSMLRQDAPQLQQALTDAGLKTDSGGLQFSLRDQSSSGQNGGNGGNPNAQRLIISDEDAVPAAVAGRSYGRSLGSSGGVDIRV